MDNCVIRCSLAMLLSLTLAACQSTAPATAPVNAPTSQSPGQNTGAATGTGSTVIYPAQTIVTMNPEQPTAEAVAVRRTRIVGVGTLAALQSTFPTARLDRRFRNRVLVPGFIDPHMHVSLGAMLYAQPFAAPWPMATGNGRSRGFATRESFLQRLAEITAAAPEDGSAITAYGFHDLIHGPLNRSELDAISPTRPLIVWHYSAHDFYLNSAALAALGATPAWATTFAGVDLDAEGQLTGRLYEDAGVAVLTTFRAQLLDPEALRAGLDRYFDILRAAGVTSTADLAWGAFDFETETALIESTWSRKRRGFQLYLIPEFRALNKRYGPKAPATVQAWVDGDLDAPAPVLPRVKFFADGAYYSQTMRVSPPGYLSGQSAGTEGLWVVEPDDLLPTLTPYTEQGFAVHIHSNGDAAQEASLNALAQLRQQGFSGDFVIEHGALFSPAQRTKAATLGAMVSVASHYVHYLADAYAAPLGPVRSQWISPVGDLTRAGAVVALHSDAPLAPPVPLLAAARHVTRLTRGGDSYATAQALTLYEALEAITLDAARVLGLEDKIGSIETGKQADFTVLSRNPLRLPANRWSSIEVWGVVLRGKPRPMDE